MKTSTISFETPSGFGAVPLNADGEMRAREVRRLLTNAPEGDVEAHEQARVLTTLGDLAISSNAFLFGILTLGKHPPSKNATLIATFTPLSSHKVNLATSNSRLEAAKAISSVITERDTSIKCYTIQLDSGPVALATRAGYYEGLPIENRRLPKFGIQMFIPVVDLQGIVIIDLSTSEIDLWPEFINRTMQFANSIKFSDSDS